MTNRFVCVLIAAALFGAAQPKSRPLTAVVSASTIRVGETATVTISGGQLDGAGGNIKGDTDEEFGGAVEISRMDRGTFAVKGLAACDCVLQFSDGRNKASVRIRVVKK